MQKAFNNEAEYKSALSLINEIITKKVIKGITKKEAAKLSEAALKVRDYESTPPYIFGPERTKYNQG